MGRAWVLVAGAALVAAAWVIWRAGVGPEPPVAGGEAAGGVTGDAGAGRRPPLAARPRPGGGGTVAGDPAEAPGEGDASKDPEHLALLEGIRTAATSTSGPKRQAWYLVSVARLLSHPGECAELVDLYRAGEGGPAGRGVILDLLANTGTADAQAALRSIFEDPSASADPEAIRRLGGIEHPEVDTADLVSRLYGNTATDRRAAAETLGAVTGKLNDDGWVDLAAQHSKRLTTDLASARTPEERAPLLEALARTRMPENLPPLLAAARDPDPTTRAAAARALRHSDDPSAKKALEALAADGDAEVKKSAAASLARKAVP